jgi:nitroreductase
MSARFAAPLPQFPLSRRHAMTDPVAFFDEMLATTRSVRRRIDFERTVEPALIYDCIDLAVQAPSSVGGETWRFVVLTEPIRKDAMATLYRKSFDTFLAAQAQELAAQGRTPEPLPPNYRYLADRMQDFPAIIVVCREGRPPADTAGQVAFYSSVIPAAWSLMLALRARRLGTTWTTLHSRYENESADIIGMPSDATAAVVLPVGHMKDARLKRAQRSPARSVTYWNQWGAADGLE